MDGSHGTEGECICLDENSIDLCPKLKPVCSFYFAAKDQMMTLLDLLKVHEEVLREMEHEKSWVDHVEATVKLHKDIYARPEKGFELYTREKVRANEIKMDRHFFEERDGFYHNFKIGLVKFRYHMLCLIKLYWDFVSFRLCLCLFD
ncbi:hypothetical protein MKX01_030509 [Papaver californicum]|nr:hypothetical protein MKX01_030509 [Papaver californicum]